MEEFNGLISGEHSLQCDVKNGDVYLGIKALVVVTDSEAADEFEHELENLLRKYAI